MKAWQLKHRDRMRVYHREYQKAWREKNVQKVRKWALEAYHALPKAEKRTKALRKFGLSIEHYEGMLSAQDGVCKICGGINTDSTLLCVDHNHKTGKIRALLCRSCNSALGLFGDSPEMLRKAADYLTEYGFAEEK